MNWKQRLGWWLVKKGAPAGVTSDTPPAVTISPEAYTAMDTLVLKFPGSTWDRKRVDGTVTLRLHLPDGNVLAAQAPTTTEAIKLLWERAEAHA